MTGQWLAEKQVIDKHFRWGFVLEDTGGIRRPIIFRDVRKFGTLDLVSNLEEYEPLNRLGYDGLELNDPAAAQELVARAANSSRPIKNFILDQQNIAGNGNLYASEVLFLEKINPKKPTNGVDMEALCLALKSLFEDAIAFRGTSISDYVGGNGNSGEYQKQLRVYGREGLPCYECGIIIQRIVQAGRSTFFCPNCQA